MINTCVAIADATVNRGEDQIVACGAVWSRFWGPIIEALKLSHFLLDEVADNFGIRLTF